MLQTLIFSFWRKLKCRSSKCIPPAAKTVAWVQHLFLHYFFTYLFSLNIMSSNLLWTCNKDGRLRDHQHLTFEFFSWICLLIYSPSHSLRADFKNTKLFFFVIPPPCLTLYHKAFHFILNHCCCETDTFMYIYKNFLCPKITLEEVYYAIYLDLDFWKPHMVYPFFTSSKQTAF